MAKARFGHLSDAHLGYTSTRKRVDENGYNVRENDGYLAFNKAIDQMIEQKVDFALITGDIFHSPRPKNHTMLIAQEGLRRLAAAGIPSYTLAGNHDATDVRMEIPSSRLLHEPNSKIYSYSDPYVLNEVMPGVFIHFVSHHAYVEQDDTMNKIELIDGAVNILASHGSTFDTNMGMVLHSPNEPREVVIPQFIMDMPWDYTLLGHIHERGWVGSKDGLTDTEGRKQYYGGSLIRRGFSDKYCKLGRGWTLWTVNDDNSITPEMFTIEERPQFDMPPINTKDKTPQEIEDEIVKQLQTVNRTIAKKYGEFTLESMPIVRQTIVGIDSVTRVSINWSRFEKFTTNYLAHQFKTIREERQVDFSQAITVESLNNSDIVAVFKEWNESVNLGIDETIKPDVLNLVENYLKISRDASLEEE